MRLLKKLSFIGVIVILSLFVIFNIGINKTLASPNSHITSIYLSEATYNNCTDCEDCYSCDDGYCDECDQCSECDEKDDCNDCSDCYNCEEGYCDDCTECDS